MLIPQKSNRKYVNNKTLLPVMQEYHDAYKKAKENGEPRPPIPNYVGECILMIAVNLANKSNFNAYSYKEEMILDGIENCVKYIHNFDPSKSNNPFAYITQMVKNSFIRRITLEKREQYIKIKNMQNYDIIDQLDGMSTTPQLNEVTDDFVRSFEQSLVTKKAASKKGLSKFFE